MFPNHHKIYYIIHVCSQSYFSTRKCPIKQEQTLATVYNKVTACCRVWCAVIANVWVNMNICHKYTCICVIIRYILSLIVSFCCYVILFCIIHLSHLLTIYLLCYLSLTTRDKYREKWTKNGLRKVPLS